MDAMESQLRSLCQEFLNGTQSAREIINRCMHLTTTAADSAHVDTDRKERCGFPEVIYAEGKSIGALVDIVRTLVGRRQSVLATRLSPEQRIALSEHFPAGRVQEIGRTFRLDPDSATTSLNVGKVAVMTAGTSDLHVALEAMETLAWMHVDAILIQDVGVAGPHRLPTHLEQLSSCDAVVVLAGMEGALPSVVGGYVNCPVIAVPTSVGYGASFQGVAALLGMLNSCAANVAVVNIDAGFKGAYLAGMIARRAAGARLTRVGG